MTTIDNSGNGRQPNVGGDASFVPPITSPTTLSGRHNDEICIVAAGVVITCPVATSLGDDYETALIAEQAFTLDLPNAADIAVAQNQIVSIVVKNGAVRVIGPTAAAIG